MPVSVDTRRAHAVRHYGDIAVIFTWVNDERSMILVPWRRPGAPWFIVADSAAYTWDDRYGANIPEVVRKTRLACEVLGILPTPTNCRRIAGIVVDGIEELVTMPSSPPKEQGPAVGSLVLRADGKPISGDDIRPEDEGVSYG